MLASLGSSNYTLDHHVVAGEIKKTRTYYPDTDDVTSPIFTLYACACACAARSVCLACLSVCQFVRVSVC